MPKKPKPYVKPAINLGTLSDRIWQTIRVTNLSAGDIVPDRGEVVSLIPMADGKHVSVQFFSGHVEYYDRFAEVWCFSLRDRSGDSS